MDRIQQIEKIVKEYLKDVYEESSKVIRKEYLDREIQICQNLADTMHSGLVGCEQMGKKVNYIIISVLESSILTNSYDLQIAFYDKNMYLDKAPMYVYWKPMLFFSKIEDDMRIFKRKVAERLVRVKDYEMDFIKRKYLINHYFQVFLFLRKEIPNVIERECKKVNCLEDKFLVLFGRYMEKPILLYQKGGHN